MKDSQHLDVLCGLSLLKSVFLGKVYNCSRKEAKWECREANQMQDFFKLVHQQQTTHFMKQLNLIFCVVKVATMLIYLTGVTFRQFYLLSMLSGGTSDFLFTTRKQSLGQGNVLHIFVILSTGGLCVNNNNNKRLFRFFRIQF